MSAIRDGGLLPIMLDKERHLLFSLHVIDEVEDKIGDIGKLQEQIESKGRMKFITWLLTLLINEGAAYKQFQATGQIDGAEVLTERVAAMLVHGAGIKGITDSIFKAFSMASGGEAEPLDPDEDEEDEEDDEGNMTAGEDE